ncbi:MAG: hypothetical protein EBQ72_04175 [Actinobacteria bacterium]|nr:hypothetical protein [Actinomycetota bacterium]
MSWNSWESYLILLLIIWYLSHQAGRLDRLHHRIEATEAALDGHLGRRAGIVAELSASNMIDPVTSAVLAQAAHDALAVEPHEITQRLDIENELTEVLLASLSDEDEVTEWLTDKPTALLISELSNVCARIQMSRTFHSEAVSDCLKIRNQWLVRIFRLAGYAQLPTVLALDTRMPSALSD